MSKTWKYVLIFLGVFALAFCVALPAIGLFFFRFNRVGMMRGFDRMPNYGFRQMPMFGAHTGIFSGLGFGLRLLVPLVIIALIVLAVVLLLRRRPQAVAATAAPAAYAAATHACPNCGRTVENSWVACPYCGAAQNPTPPPPPAETPAPPPPPDTPDAQI